MEGLEDDAADKAQALLGQRPALVGLAPAAVEEEPFGLTELHPDLAVARGLTGLPPRTMAEVFAEIRSIPGRLVIGGAEGMLESPVFRGV